MQRGQFVLVQVLEVCAMGKLYKVFGPVLFHKAMDSGTMHGRLGGYSAETPGCAISGVRGALRLE